MSNKRSSLADTIVRAFNPWQRIRELERELIDTRREKRPALHAARQSTAPDRCPFCNAARRSVQYVPTLGNEASYWCGRKLNDNGGSWQRDWTTCRDR